MADGSHKPIEQVQVGDWVLSRNEATGETEARQVTGTTVHRALQTVSVTLTDPKTGQRQAIVCTPNHPFYVQGQGFTPAGSLGIGTSIVTRAGPSLSVSSIGLQAEQAGASEGTLVYNLTVEGDHTYFVGTVDGGAWVHNIDCNGVTVTSNGDRIIPIARNLKEQLIMEEAVANSGEILPLKGGIGDPAFQDPGWEKRGFTHTDLDGDKTTVHWMHNTVTGENAQIKIKPNRYGK